MAISSDQAEVVFPVVTDVEVITQSSTWIDGFGNQACFVGKRVPAILRELIALVFNACIPITMFIKRQNAGFISIGIEAFAVGHTVKAGDEDGLAPNSAVSVFFGICVENGQATKK